MSRAAVVAIRQASDALLNGDRAPAESVVEGDAALDALRVSVTDLVPVVLARQQPVAADLRLVMSSMQIAADLERMGDLAEHIATTVLRRYPDPVVSPPARQIMTAMAAAAERIAAGASVVLSTRDPIHAAQLGLDDDEMDELHSRLFAILVDDWRYGVEAAVDLALVGRFYERYADHAVNVARQVVYLVTGDVRL